MTLDEARIVARIVGTAFRQGPLHGGGCRSCTGGLVDCLRKELPQFRWRLAGEDWEGNPVNWNEWYETEDSALVQVEYWNDEEEVD